VIEHNKFNWLYEKVGECSKKKSSEKLATATFPETPKPSVESSNPTDGVFVEPPKEPPKKAIWVEKPNHLRNK